MMYSRTAGCGTPEGTFRRDSRTTQQRGKPCTDQAKHDMMVCRMDSLGQSPSRHSTHWVPFTPHHALPPTRLRPLPMLNEEKGTPDSVVGVSYHREASRVSRDASSQSIPI